MNIRQNIEPGPDVAVFQVVIVYLGQVEARVQHDVAPLNEGMLSYPLYRRNVGYRLPLRFSR